MGYYITVPVKIYLQDLAALRRPERSVPSRPRPGLLPPRQPRGPASRSGLRSTGSPGPPIQDGNHNL